MRCAELNRIVGDASIEALKEAFALDLRVLVWSDGSLCYLYPNGSCRALKRVSSVGRVKVPTKFVI